MRAFLLTAWLVIVGSAATARAVGIALVVPQVVTVPVDSSFVIPVEEVDTFAPTTCDGKPLPFRINPIDAYWTRVMVTAPDGIRFTLHDPRKRQAGRNGRKG